MFACAEETQDDNYNVSKQAPFEHFDLSTGHVPVRCHAAAWRRRCVERAVAHGFVAAAACVCLCERRAPSARRGGSARAAGTDANQGCSGTEHVWIRSFIFGIEWWIQLMMISSWAFIFFLVGSLAARCFTRSGSIARKNRKLCQATCSSFVITASFRETNEFFCLNRNINASMNFRGTKSTIKFTQVFSGIFPPEFFAADFQLLIFFHSMIGQTLRCLSIVQW